MSEQNSPAPVETSSRLPEIWALIWRSHETDDLFDQSTFDERVPRLMAWLRELRASGHLVACGGGGFANHAGGLTLVRAADPEEAARLAAGSPMNEIGTTETFIWDVFFAELDVPRQF
jgi:uncharacterized protein YciI